MIGMIFFQFGVTVAFAVLVSLFVSFTLDPMLSSVWHDPDVRARRRRTRRATRNARRARASPSAAWPSRSTIGSSAWPTATPWLRWALRHRPWCWCIARRRCPSSRLRSSCPSRLHLAPGRGRRRIQRDLQRATRLEPRLHDGKGLEIARFLQREPEVDFTYITVGGGAAAARGSNGGRIVRPSGRPRPSATGRRCRYPGRPARTKLRGITGVRVHHHRDAVDLRRLPAADHVNVQGPEHLAPQDRRRAGLRRDAQSPRASRSPIRAMRARSRKSTCTSIGSRRGPPAGRLQHRDHAPAAVHRAARDALGGRAGISSTT